MTRRPIRQMTGEEGAHPFCEFFFDNAETPVTWQVGGRGKGWQVSRTTLEHGRASIGRSDDVIVRGGENISPGEIEDVLLTHSAIAAAAVVAVPSTEWGEAVGLALVVRGGFVAPGKKDVRFRPGPPALQPRARADRDRACAALQ